MINRSSNFYDDAIISFDGVVYARGEAYKRLTLSDQSSVEFRPILTINAVSRTADNSFEYVKTDIPSMRELILLDITVYLGVTINDQLFSFVSGQLMGFESPIVSVNINSAEQLILILLENGQLRAIGIDEHTHQLVDRDDWIDDSIPSSIAHLSSIEGYNYQWLMITHDNQYSIIKLRLEGEYGDPHLKMGRVLDCPIDDHNQIKMVKSGTILMNDDRIFILRRPEESKREISQLNHSITDIVDISSPTEHKVIVLKANGELTIIYDRDIICPVQYPIEFKPVRLLTHYHNSVGDIFIQSHHMIAQNHDGSIRRFFESGQVNDLRIPGQLITTLGRMTKSAAR